MPVDSTAKRHAVAHLKRPGRGVFPGTTSTTLGRGAIGWNYVTDIPIPPVGGDGLPGVGLGHKKSFSDAAELGGGSW